MHYPLAMLLLALMDQRACKELEEPGPLQQNKTDREEEDGGTGWQTEGRGQGERDGGREGGGGGLWGSRLSERRQLDPPERRQLRAEVLFRGNKKLGEKSREYIQRKISK